MNKTNYAYVSINIETARGDGKKRTDKKDAKSKKYRTVLLETVRKSLHVINSD